MLIDLPSFSAGLPLDCRFYTLPSNQHLHWLLIQEGTLRYFAPKSSGQEQDPPLLRIN